MSPSLLDPLWILFKATCTSSPYPVLRHHEDESNHSPICSLCCGSVSFILLVLVIDHILSSRSASDAVDKRPKMFFVSTSATTSTLQTASICYVSSNALSACTGRKKRAIATDELSFKDVASVELEPSRKEQESPAIEGSREGRFLLYWITTTSISTSTSFTTTYTVSSIVCTPAGANLCG